MSNRLDALLVHWRKHKLDMQWVLATLVEVEGSSYRNPGAMMLINDLGRYYGLLSGGCLESDIMRQARRCWDDNKQRVIEYDMRQEEDLAWQLGIGCGGRVSILLQPVTPDNGFLMLEELYGYISTDQLCWYLQPVNREHASNELRLADPNDTIFDYGVTQVDYSDGCFRQLVTPSPHLGILGGGADSLPLASIACALGWRVTLVDPRQSYARRGYFPASVALIHQDYDSLKRMQFGRNIDAFMVMHHNVALDAQALDFISELTPRYIGLLGPEHRTARVNDAALVDIRCMNIANPAGLQLGGDLPESIALSIISEIHAVLNNENAVSISGYV